MAGGVRPLGRRRRRLIWTAGLLAVGCLLASAGGWAVYRSARAPEYRPGEKLDEITSQLDLGLPADAPRLAFADVTIESGVEGFRAFAGRRTSQLPEDMGSGAAWGDFDADGDDDLFLVSQGGPLDAPVEARERSRLYENRGDGTFSEVAGFPETRILGMGAAWGDHDADGDLDLVVSGYDTLLLFRNERGRLVHDPRLIGPEGYWAGVAWGDFDLDSDLDLYVCGYVQYVESAGATGRVTQQYGQAVPYTLNPASFDPERNLLFRNDGPSGFSEIAAKLGVDNPTGRSLGAAWHDLDDNGWPDLYVANDISDNALYLNRVGRFEDRSHPAWVADYRGAMGLAVGDWNRDGDDDLFVSHWIAQENALYDSLLADLARRGEPGDLRFMDVADQRGLGQIALQFVGWGAEFADLDSDGWLDLVVANGSTFETGGVPPELRPQKSFAFWNRAGEAFHDLAPLVPALAQPRVSRGLALSDYDIDGDLDLLFVDRDGGARLLRNDTPQAHRIGLRLRRRAGAPVEGTRIVAQVGSVTLRRALDGVSYLSQSSRVAHLGLGQASRVDVLEVRWPGGSEERFENLAANALYELIEGEPAPRRIADWDAGNLAREMSREQLVEFWRLQRAGMHAMKVDGEFERAIGLFEQALGLDPGHEDSLYYLGNCLAETGNVSDALSRLAELMRLNPQSHRAHKRWGVLRAQSAQSAAELDAAIEALERATAINPEETGASLALAEVELLRGHVARARQRLEWVVRTNPRAAEAFFLLAYLDWSGGNTGDALRHLERAVAARGPDWKPPGSAAEGDVRKRMHTEATPFEDVYGAWNGTLDVAEAVEPLATRLR